MMDREKSKPVDPVNADVSARVDALYQDGVAAWNGRRYADAAHAMSLAIELDPTLPALYYLLGSARLELSDHVAAQTAFEDCLALHPADPLAPNAKLRAAQAWARHAIFTGQTPSDLVLSGDDHRSISVIVCSIRPERFARVCNMYRQRLIGIQHELIGIHDALSLCEGYNRGIHQAKGDILIFSHDDIHIASPDFAARLLAALTEFDLVGVAGATRIEGGEWTHARAKHMHGQVGIPGSAPGEIVVNAFNMRGYATPGAQVMDGLFFAARRTVTEKIQFDEATFDGWHLYDFDFTYRVQQAGFSCAIVHDMLIVHESMGNFDQDWLQYSQRFLTKHGIQGQGQPTPPEISAVTVHSIEEWRLMTERLTTCGRD